MNVDGNPNWIIPPGRQTKEPRSPNAELMLGHRRRRWPNNNSALGRCTLSPGRQTSSDGYICPARVPFFIQLPKYSRLGKCCQRFLFPENYGINEAILHHGVIITIR